MNFISNLCHFLSDHQDLQIAPFIEVAAMIICTFNAKANPPKPVDCIRRIAEVFIF